MKQNQNQCRESIFQNGKISEITQKSLGIDQISVSQIIVRCLIYVFQKFLVSILYVHIALSGKNIILQPASE